MVDGTDIKATQYAMSKTQQGILYLVISCVVVLNVPDYILIKDIPAHILVHTIKPLVSVNATVSLKSQLHCAENGTQLLFVLLRDDDSNEIKVTSLISFESLSRITLYNNHTSLIINRKKVLIEYNAK